MAKLTRGSSTRAYASEPLTFRTLRSDRVDFRDDDRVFGIKHEDRFSHVYVIGKTDVLWTKLPRPVPAFC
jgi:hypothetical protein